MLELISEAQLGKAVESNPQVQSASRIMLAVGCNAVVVKVEIERRGGGEQSRRRKEVTEPVQRMVVLGSHPVPRAYDEIVAKFRSKSADIMKRNPCAQRETNISVIRSIDHERRIHRRRRVVLLIRTDEQAVYVVLPSQLKAGARKTSKSGNVGQIAIQPFEVHWLA